jgi:2-polyprenyl-3-methyl-5-hydroxy-6-metoxy-1,4-benzoquinol methylase
MPDVTEPSDLVRNGYNRIASAYLAARLNGLPDPPLLAQFSDLLPPNALVLDAGSGAGVPVAAFLSKRHRVVSIDFAFTQARMASRLVPSALVACVDMTQPTFPSGIFDGICSFYAILHIPRSRHSSLIAAFFHLLRDDGLVLLCLGAEDTEADYGPYFGARMYWSHFDSGQYLDLLAATGFSVLSSGIQPDPISKIANHLFVLARRVGV